jgi:putative tricarboxylic transport membrane protein
VAGPESANNANASAGFVPLMTLGIPTHAQMAIIYAALLINGLQPGPMLIKNNPSFFWGVIASMYVGNVMLVALNLPLIGLWVRFLRIPYTILFPAILFFLVLGSYTINNNIVHVLIMIIFGVFGYLMRKFKYEPAPLIMGFVLSRIIEGALIRSLLMSQGSPSIFFRNSICISLIAMSLLLLSTSLLQKKTLAKEPTYD